MSYNLYQIKAVFNTPQIREELEKKNYDILFNTTLWDNDTDARINYEILAGMSDYYSLNIASFCINELKFPILNYIDTLYEGMFFEDYNISTIVVPENVLFIQGIAYDCPNLSTVVIESKKPLWIGTNGYLIQDCPDLEYIGIKYPQDFSADDFKDYVVDCPRLKNVEIGLVKN